MEMMVKMTRRLEKCIQGSEMKKEKQLRPFLYQEIILYEILPWVPLKSLFRFKLVCKEWCRVISTDSVFKTLQSRRCVSLPPGLIYYGRTSVYVIYGSNTYKFLPTIGKDFVGMPDPSLKYMNIFDGHLQASSNGMLCGFHNREGEEYIYVSNPITKELVYIPNSYEVCDVALAFDPLNCEPYYVLVGRYAANVETGEFFDVIDVGFRVYSSKVGMWSTSNAKVQLPRYNYIGTRFKKDRAIFIGERLYWKTEIGVLWFNIKKDSAGIVPLPNEEKRYFKWEIGDCNGELSYSIITTENIEIWMLRFRSSEKIEFEWGKKYCLSLSSIFEGKDRPPCFHTMMNIIRKDCNTYQRVLPYEGGDLVQIWVAVVEKIVEDIIFLYNMKTGSLQWILYSEMDWWGVVLSYKCSLAMVPTSPIV